MKSTLLFFKNMTAGKILLISLSPIITMLLNMKSILFALAIIITIDMLTGIQKNLHLKGIKFRPHKAEFWSYIHSSGLRATWRKSYEYVIGILVFVILDTMVLGNTSVSLLGKTYSIAELAVTIACLVEVYSIYENMEAVSGNNLFKKIIRVMPRKVQAIFSDRKRRGHFPGEECERDQRINVNKDVL